MTTYVVKWMENDAMKVTIAACAAAVLASSACAQSPTPPATPDTPNVTTIQEDCGEGCSRTITKIKSSKTGKSGADILRKDVEIIELRTGETEDVSVDVDVETIGDGENIVRKKVKVISASGGEITPEMRAKIDGIIREYAGDEGSSHQEGDGLMVFNSSDDAETVQVFIRKDGEDFTSSSDVNVEQTENEDGSRTIRVTPDNGGDTTVITISTENSSKSDN